MMKRHDRRGQAISRETSMRSFFRELRRRNVYKVGAMYAVAGWLLVQIATQVLPIFDVSALAQRIIVLMIVAGFPVALVLSWIYELTPQGIVKTGDVAPDESITTRTGQKLNYSIIAILALAVTFLLAQRYLFPPRSTAAADSISDKSIAVLPFANLSEEKSNEYFAEGIQDEILTRLAKVGALKVISRTSTAHYASSPSNLPEIAKQLGVANILEGSVQKIGDAVHINVQLIRAATDDHLWAEIYNRKLNDIFTVQSDVSSAIAQALNAKLSGAEQEAIATKSTDNLIAYEAFLRGRSLSLRGYDYGTTRKVAEAYGEAVKLDPKFATAWANLVITSGYLYFNNVDRDRYTADFIKQAADNASKLEPDSSEAFLAIGNYRYRVLRDFDAARQSLEEAAQRSPNDSRAWQFLALVERREGRWDDAITHFMKAANLDPLNAGLMTTIGGETFTNMRRYDDALQWLDRALTVSPDSGLATTYKAVTYQNEGRLADAARVLDGFAGDDPTLVAQRVYQRLLERDYAKAISEAQSELSKTGDLDGYRPQLQIYLGQAQRGAGNAAAAQATFEQLVKQLAPLRDQVDDSLIPVILAGAKSFAGDRDALAQAQRAAQQYAKDANMAQLAQAAVAQAQMVSGDKGSAVQTLSVSLNSLSGVTKSILRLDPIWDPLRNEASFQALLKD
jgi:TolB-like protein/Tfp pilus assembly protein PilF